MCSQAPLNPCRVRRILAGALNGDLSALESSDLFSPDRVKEVRSNLSKASIHPTAKKSQSLTPLPSDRHSKPKEIMSYEGEQYDRKSEEETSF